MENTGGIMRTMWAVFAVSAMMMFGALTFLWIGTAHRDRCVKAGEAGCSILPWSGHHASGYMDGGSSGNVFETP